MKIPKSHQRYDSLMRRETLVRAWKAGIVVPEGLIAHGRGEAFDYLYGADVVLVPLEDGDRAEALVRMEKVVISVDLNPFSRTTRTASIPVVDELSRALLNIHRFAHELRDDPKEITRLTRTYDKDRNMAALYSFLRLGLSGVRGTGGTRGRRRP